MPIVYRSGGFKTFTLQHHDAQLLGKNHPHTDIKLNLCVALGHQ